MNDSTIRKYILLGTISDLSTTSEIFNAISFCDLNKSIIWTNKYRRDDYCYSRLLKKKGIERWKYIKKRLLYVQIIIIWTK